jgi:hypothetical protein
MFGYTTVTETVQVPDGAALLLSGVKMLKKGQRLNAVPRLTLQS